MYVMFLDETGDHSLTKIDPQYPVFCLAGCIFDVDYYNKKANKIIDKVKQLPRIQKKQWKLLQQVRSY